MSAPLSPLQRSEMAPFLAAPPENESPRIPHRRNIGDVEQEIHDELRWVPESLTQEDRKAIRDEVIAQTRLVADVLTVEELQNEGERRSMCGDRRITLPTVFRSVDADSRPALRLDFCRV